MIAKIKMKKKSIKSDMIDQRNIVWVRLVSMPYTAAHFFLLNCESKHSVENESQKDF